MTISAIENESLSLQIYQASKEAGYDDCGIISVDDMAGFIANVENRIETVPASAGFNQRAFMIMDKLKNEFPWVKSIVICLSEISKFRYPKELQGMYAKGLFISRDSAKNGPEYNKKLNFGQWFDAHNIVWTGPTHKKPFEIWGLRHAAEMAGLGIIRKNNALYNENGSWLELDVYLISEHCRLYQQKQISPCPENCDHCQKACPTNALYAPYTLNPLHCVSAINTLGKAVIPDGVEEEQLGKWFVGCDACQDACPFNEHHDWSKGEPYPGLEELVDFMSPKKVLETNAEVLSKKLCNSCSRRNKCHKDANTLKVNAKRVISNSKYIVDAEKI